MKKNSNEVVTVDYIEVDDINKPKKRNDGRNTASFLPEFGENFFIDLIHIFFEFTLTGWAIKGTIEDRINKKAKKAKSLKTKSINNSLKNNSIKKSKSVKNTSNDTYYEPTPTKILDTRCAIISTIIVLLSSILVYKEASLLYAFPLISAVFIFLVLCEGCSKGSTKNTSDFKLYIKILKINIFALSIIFLTCFGELWFVNFNVIFVFLIPFILFNTFKKAS